jgi:hypothetical protein
MFTKTMWARIIEKVVMVFFFIFKKHIRFVLNSGVQVINWAVSHLDSDAHHCHYSCATLGEFSPHIFTTEVLFTSKPVHVEFVVKKVAMGQIFL